MPPAPLAVKIPVNLTQPTDSEDAVIPQAGDLLADGRAGTVSFSRSPWRSHQRRIPAGAHQFQSPSSFMVAGTSSIRTMVASTSRATSMPIPIIFMNTMPLVEKAPITTASSRAALVMMRPVRCTPVATARVVVVGEVPLLPDPGEQEDLVVHRQPDQDRQHEDRLGRVEEAGRGEAERTLEWPSAKIQVITPNEALIESRFITIAFNGSTSDPNARNSSTSITTAMISAIHGRWLSSEREQVDGVGAEATDEDVLAVRTGDVADVADDLLRRLGLAVAGPASHAAACGRRPGRPGVRRPRRRRPPTFAVYAATSASSVVPSMMFAVERSGPKSVFSVSAATWAGLSGGSTR